MNSEILLGEREDGDAGQIHLLPPGELQQKVERTLEPVEIDGERRIADRTVQRRNRYETAPLPARITSC